MLVLLDVSGHQFGGLGNVWREVFLQQHCLPDGRCFGVGMVGLVHVHSVHSVGDSVVGRVQSGHNGELLIEPVENLETGHARLFG